MNSRDLPEHVSRIVPGDVFTFLCHKQISCFTHCCRELELILTPYDVLRLRRATGLSSAELHRRYIIEEFTEADAFPRYYLSMVDDGRASCVFVNDRGCSIYPDRPGACRTYPLGRGTVYDRNTGTVKEQFILVREPHCRGFAETSEQTVERFTASQELEVYNRFNDLLTAITQHEKVKEGMRLSEYQVNLYRTALYDLDTFRAGLKEEGGGLSFCDALSEEVFADDETLLEFALGYVQKALFFS